MLLEKTEKLKLTQSSPFSHSPQALCFANMIREMVLDLCAHCLLQIPWESASVPYSYLLIHAHVACTTGKKHRNTSHRAGRCSWMKQTCSYGEKIPLTHTKKLVETSLYPCASQMHVAIKALLVAFVFLPIQMEVCVSKDSRSSSLEYLST